MQSKALIRRAHTYHVPSEMSALGQKQALESLSHSETKLNPEKPAPVSTARIPSLFGFRTETAKS